MSEANKAPKYSQQDTHWYMAAVELHYRHDEKDGTSTLRAQKLNVMIMPKRRKITAQDMGDIRYLALLRMKEEYKIDKERIADFIVLNIMYLGHMSELAYFTEQNSSFDQTK